jgi:beta-lactam-binding protein with PASTA domain
VIKLGQAGLRPKLQVRTSGPRDGLVAEQRPVPTQKVSLGAPVIVLLDRLPAPKPAPAQTKPKPKPQQATTTVTTTTTTPAHTTTAPSTTSTQSQATTTTPTTTSAAPAPAPTPAPTQATVPDVSGKTEAAAVDAFAKAGLLVSIVFVPSSDNLGMVEAQSKPSGTTLPARSHVQLNLSGGNGKFPPESIPNVVGKTLHDAVAAMNGAQLRLIYEKQPVTNQASVGKIVQQTPLAGGKAPQHAQVLVYLGVLQH